ncbi:hypothetical protein P3U41_05705 [Mammaliicoccus sciuri]|uniref:hypothetical protein n=1 Tax=Mammaliicoccus sciuri TaxID=1296 RepID=UPI002B25ACFE|nr:hypothetical protein [Mammaliicoccus sciuri]WQL34264.1 hypothetical protein P3U41_05705 [Mammaliicoccus sciuri]WQL61203.1 hypothetical protein P3T96_05705 [Mammaliicoccus sciuri]
MKTVKAIKLGKLIQELENNDYEVYFIEESNTIGISTDNNTIEIEVFARYEDDIYSVDLELYELNELTFNIEDEEIETDNLNDIYNAIEKELLK